MALKVLVGRNVTDYQEIWSTMPKHRVAITPALNVAHSGPFALILFPDGTQVIYKGDFGRYILSQRNYWKFRLGRLVCGTAVGESVHDELRRAISVKCRHLNTFIFKHQRFLSR